MSTNTRVSEFGRRWNAKTPRHSIRHIVDRLHVSLSDEEVQQRIADRIANARLQNPLEWTSAIERQSLEFAVLVHRQNQTLFRRVMGG